MGATGRVWGCQKEKMEERQSLGGTHIFLGCRGLPPVCRERVCVRGMEQEPFEAR